jgi:hypothetical protein
MNTTQIRLATLATALTAALIFVGIAPADEITGSIKISPNLTHTGPSGGSELTETLYDVWKWAGTSANLGTQGLATAMTILYVKNDTIAGSGTNTYDLYGTLEDSFGNTVNLAKVKFMVLCPSNSMGATQSVLIEPAPAAGFASWQSTTTSATRVFSGGVWMTATASTNGYTVTATTGDILQIRNESTNAASYRLFIGGE